MAFAPCVVVLHTEADDIGTIVVHQRIFEYEEQRVSFIDGQIDLATQDEIVLSVALIDIVDERRAAKGVARIKQVGLVCSKAFVRDARLTGTSTTGYAVLGEGLLLDCRQRIRFAVNECIALIASIFIGGRVGGLDPP